MKRPLFAFLLSTFLVIDSVTVSVEGQEKPRRGFLSALHEGQSVMLRENAGRFDITIIKGLQAGHKVIEVGNDFIVVEDIAGVTETRIPIYSIKIIVKVKVPKE